MMSFFKGYRISGEQIIVSDFAYKDYLDMVLDKAENIFFAHSKYKNISDYIMSILFSNKYSVYSTHMSINYRRKINEYISKCIDEKQRIHIVLAGMPGKCANRQKVKHILPDLGEFVCLAQFEQIYKLISMVYSPGVRFTFFSDYIGLKFTFFPIEKEIYYYIDFLQKWINEYKLHIDIIPVTHILPQINRFEKYYYNDRIPNDLLNRSVNDSIEDKLVRSIGDNINIDNAREFYESTYGIKASNEQILFIAAKYYRAFWDFWNSENAVNKYFGDVIYASPVAYHAEKRLCIRLQNSGAKLAPWNGVGTVFEKKIYSTDERNCVSYKYKKIVGNDGYIYGYKAEF